MLEAHETMPTPTRYRRQESSALEGRQPNDLPTVLILPVTMEHVQRSYRQLAIRAARPALISLTTNARPRDAIHARAQLLALFDLARVGGRDEAFSFHLECHQNQQSGIESWTSRAVDHARAKVHGGFLIGDASSACTLPSRGCSGSRANILDFFF